jgi:hypothetical protein
LKARTLAQSRVGFRPSGLVSASQINPSKTKEIQGKLLGFPWIPLVESWLFNGLQRIQMENFPLLDSFHEKRPAGRDLFSDNLDRIE